MFKIISESPEDADQIEALLDRVFGPDRHGKASYAFRRSVAPVPELCLVARDGERLVGTIRFWPVMIGAAPALLLGPVGVSPDRQKIGVGRSLIGRGHAVARSLGHKIVLLVGAGDYYCRFGYWPAAAHGISMPGEAAQRLLIHELAVGSLQGVSGELIQPAGKIASGPVA